MTRHQIDGPRRGVCQASGISERPPSQLRRPKRTIFYERPRRRRAHTGQRRQPRDSSLAGPHRHSESVPLGSRAIRAITGVAPIVSFSASVSERATRVSTPWLTGRQYPLAPGPPRPSARQSAAGGAQAVSTPLEDSSHSGRPERAGLDPGRVIRSLSPLCGGRVAAGPAARPHRCWPGQGLKRSRLAAIGCIRVRPT